MKGIGGWFRNFSAKITAGLRRFMDGRYGTDRLNMAMLSVGFFAAVVQILLPGCLLKTVLFLISYVCMIWAIFRMLSRNTYRRYEENRRFLQLLDRFKDRDHRYYNCPKCRQRVRVPRGKGKIAITCPKCREKFVRKT